MLKILDEVCTPTMGSKYSAAIDLYAREDVVIGVGETVKVPLGVCLEYDKFPIYLKNNLDKFYLQLEPRSSLRAKGLQAGTGFIDIDYQDEIKIILSNPMTQESCLKTIQKQLTGVTYKKGVMDYTIEKGQKVAQVMLKGHKTYLMGISTEDKRVGGFGSTGN